MDNNQNEFNQTNFEEEKIEQTSESQTNFEQPSPEPGFDPEPEPKFEPAPEPVIKKSVLAAKDPLFLSMCILISITAFSAFNIINILVAIGMWIAFANAKTGKSLLSPAKLCAGALKALYIIFMVVSILLIVAGGLGLISGLIAPASFSDPFVIDQIYSFEEFQPVINDLLAEDLPLGMIMAILAMALFIVMIIIGVVFLIINCLFTKSVCTFANSVKANVESDAPIEKAKTVSGWVLAFAILSGISVVSDGLGASGAAVALYIVTYIWFRNNFIKE